jgi:hypothetical protein
LKPDFELSPDEMDARLAAAATSYGVGTKSYNASSEKKELDRQKKAVTEKYLAAPRFEVILDASWFVCHCRAFADPHGIEKHRELRAEWDWRPESDRRGLQYRVEGVR